MARAPKRAGGLAVLVAVAAIGLVACTSATSTPQVAALPASSPPGAGNSPGAGSSSGAGSSDGSNPTRLVDEWAACMRAHGDPNQVDPVIDSDGDIEITMVNVSAALSAQAHDSAGPCGNYLVEAANALRDGKPVPQAPSMAQQLKYVACMRSHGVPNYPDPDPANPDKTNFNGTGIDPNSPVFQSADKVCSAMDGSPPAGTPVAGVVQVMSCNGSPNCKLPSDGQLPSEPGVIQASGNG